jgi:hypothetical protein
MEQDLAKIWRDLQHCMQRLGGSTVTVTTVDGRRIEHFRPQDFIATSLVHVRGVIDGAPADASVQAFDLSAIQSVTMEGQAEEAEHAPARGSVRDRPATHATY